MRSILSSEIFGRWDFLLGKDKLPETPIVYPESIRAGLRPRFSRDGNDRVSRSYHTWTPSWKYLWEGVHTELIARSREIAAVAARELFARFGLAVSVETLGSIQAEMGR